MQLALPELSCDYAAVVPLQLREGGPCQGTVASLQENEDTFQLADPKVRCLEASQRLIESKQACSTSTCRPAAHDRGNAHLTAATRS